MTRFRALFASVLGLATTAEALSACTTNHRFATTSDAGGDASTSAATEEEIDDAGAEAEPIDDAAVVDSDAGVVEDGGGGDALDATVPSGDAAADVYKPPPPPPPPVDSGPGTDSGPADAAADAADAGPCVDYVRAPESPTWAGWAEYTLGPGTTQSVPYYCTYETGPGCRGTIILKGGILMNGEYRLYPAPGACRINVPDACLPCTAGKTQW